MADEDRVTQLRLYSPRSHDFIRMRPDGTTYIEEIRKNKDVIVVRTPEKQLNLFDIL